MGLQQKLLARTLLETVGERYSTKRGDFAADSLQVQQSMLC
jgi:hypothetical protein